MVLVSYLASSSTVKMKAPYSSETDVDLKGIHILISQKITLFIRTTPL
jgi:hypothetical protein